ncbi:hypothetical protein [Motilibacter deserti]|uniref:Ig-like domain-containing protein n=1 Tax=Motilibacter deserti TaxID=2714956 RepID=A0ABX0GTH0_9ACTN|nr:hypothetical protein [Motilibacter deserti]NHC13119.1 hypothetical protein [Motilibacter deserti]
MKQVRHRTVSRSALGVALVPLLAAGALPASAATASAAPTVKSVKVAGKMRPDTLLTCAAVVRGADRVRYTWLVNGTTVLADQASPEHLLTGDMPWSGAVSCRVQATNGSGTATRTSVVRWTRGGRPLDNVVRPTISGAFEVGQLLTVDPGTWTPSPDDFYITWMRDGKEIHPQGNPDYYVTGETYRIKPEDLGHRISALVEADKVNYSAKGLRETHREKVRAPRG